MYYKAKPDEYVKWESLDKHGNFFQYEIKVSKVAPAHVPFLDIFKLYEAMYPELAEATQWKDKFHLATHRGIVEYPYETRIIRGAEERALLDLIKSGDFKYNLITERDFI